MEKVTVQDLTSSSAVMKNVRSEREEKRRALYDTLANLQARFDADVPSFVPSAVTEQVHSTKAKADLEAALRRVSELETQNKTLQDRLKEKEEKNKQLQQRQKELEENLLAEKVKSDVERQHSEELTNNLIEALQELRSYTEATKSHFMSEIKRLEGELEAADLKYKRANSKAKQAFKENMMKVYFLREIEAEQTRREMDALFEKKEQAHQEHVNQLTSKIKELEQDLEQKVSRAGRMDQASQTEEEVETAQKEDEDLRQKLLQERLANTRAKALQANLRAEIERLCKLLNDEIQSKAPHQQQQQSVAGPCPQQERPLGLQMLLDQEIQSHKSTSSLVLRLEDENKRLKVEIQEQLTANASVERRLKSEKQRHDALMKVYKSTVEERKSLKKIIEILTEDGRSGKLQKPPGQDLEQKLAKEKCPAA